MSARSSNDVLCALISRVSMLGWHFHRKNLFILWKKEVDFLWSINWNCVSKYLLYETLYSAYSSVLMSLIRRLMMLILDIISSVRYSLSLQFVQCWNKKRIVYVKRPYLSICIAYHMAVRPVSGDVTVDFTGDEVLDVVKVDVNLPVRKVTDCWVPKSSSYLQDFSWSFSI